MEILLLSIASFALKAIVTHFPIDQDVTSNDTNARATIS